MAVIKWSTKLKTMLPPRLGSSVRRAFPYRGMQWASGLAHRHEIAFAN
jgi:hypothetical protein